MKKQTVNLHMSRKSALLIIASFSVMLFLAFFIILLSTRTDILLLNSLIKSAYSFSAEVENSKEDDSYYVFNAGIGFSLSAGAETSVNADIVMQSDKVAYTGKLYWNANNLSVYDIAITEGVAGRYGLRLEDKMYSKHIVDGEIREYTIKQILPNVSTVRVEKNGSYSDGIIVMGYDPSYVDNISYSMLVYTNETVERLAELTNGMPVKLLYRADETKRVSTRMIPYYVVLVILSVVIQGGLIAYLSKRIHYNFQRLKMLGYEKQALNKAYDRLSLIMGGVTIVISLLLSMGVCAYIGLNVVVITIILSIIIVEILTLLCAWKITLKKLWRR